MLRSPPLQSVTGACVVALLCLLAWLPLSGCRPARTEAPAPAVPAVTVIAYLERSCPASEATLAELQCLREQYPGAVSVEIVDLEDPEGARRWREADLDCSALVINGVTTVAWEEDGRRRTVSFLYPPGLAWRLADLHAAVEAGVGGALRPAAPEEAEAVRLIPATVRAQAIRAGDSGTETGQLIINKRVVIETTEPRGELEPCQRVTLAAEGLTDVLQRPFTPDWLRTEPVEEGAAVIADSEQLLVATKADARARGVSVAALADEWRRALRDALARAALEDADPRTQHSVAG